MSSNDPALGGQSYGAMPWAYEFRSLELFLGMRSEKFNLPSSGKEQHKWYDVHWCPNLSNTVVRLINWRMEGLERIQRIAPEWNGLPNPWMCKRMCWSWGVFTNLDNDKEVMYVYRICIPLWLTSCIAARSPHASLLPHSKAAPTFAEIMTATSCTALPKRRRPHWSPSSKNSIWAKSTISPGAWLT